MNPNAIVVPTMEQEVARILVAWLHRRSAASNYYPLMTMYDAITVGGTAMVRTIQPGVLAVNVTDYPHIDRALQIELISGAMVLYPGRHIQVRNAPRGVMPSQLVRLATGSDAPEAPRGHVGPVFRTPDLSLPLFARLRSAMPED